MTVEHFEPATEMTALSNLLPLAIEHAVEQSLAGRPLARCLLRDKAKTAAYLMGLTVAKLSNEGEHA